MEGPHSLDQARDHYGDDLCFYASLGRVCDPRSLGRGANDAYRKFQEKDLNLLENERTMLDWAGKQTYIALANMMTTAALLGIDSCPIEGFQMDSVQAILEEENLLEDGHLAVSVMVAFGYRTGEPNRPKSRKAIEEIVQWIR